MKLQSTRLGEFEIDEEQIIDFPRGIPGFPDEKAFVHIPYGVESPFSFLQSANEPNLTFLLVDPFAFFTDYEFELDDEAASELGVSSENPPQVFLIANVKGEIADLTVNLLAPVILNPVNHIGRQIILEKKDYSIRHKLFSQGGE